MTRNELQNLQTRLVLFKDETKAKNVNNRIELSVNENSKSLQTLLNLLDIYEILLEVKQLI